MYPNWIYRFASPTGFYNIMARVPMECNALLISIDWFARSKISFKFFKQIFFVVCWLVYIVFTVSAFIGPETCTWVWLQIFYDPYPNWTYYFDSLTCLWKVMERVLVFRYTCYHPFIKCVLGNHLNLFVLIFVKIFSSCIIIDSKISSVVVTAFWFKTFLI